MAQFARQYRYYEILGVSRNAPQDEIRRAYLKLAKMYHPDVNQSPEAQEKFKKINEAYEILANPTRRASYDNSPTECPVCWTHEVIQIISTQFRCRHCGCKFDPSRVSEVIEQVEKAAIPERLRKAVRIFQTTQCSWCSNFYTQPFLCPYGRLQSNCFSFKRLGEEERRSLLGDEKWWWRMADMLQRVQEKGIIAKCRERGCFALNPNPQKSTCWQCGKESLCCPGCKEEPFLRYDIEKDFWKCPNTAHGKKYRYVQKERVTKPILSQEICPNCSKNLYYDAELLLWRCKNCKRIYTYQDLRSKHTQRKVEPKRKQKATPQTKHSHIPAKKSSPWRLRVSPSMKKFLRSLTKLLLCLLVIIGLGVIARTGYLLFTHQTAAVTGTIIFLAEIGFLIWIISVLRSSRYRWRKPSFKLTIFSVIAILLIFTFAGVQPLAGYKDNFIESYEVAQAERAAQMEAEEAARIAQEEAAAAARAKQEAVEAAAKAEAEAQELANAERETFRLINAERGYAGVPPIEWDDELYKLSKAHTQAMADRGGLFHSAMGASYGENAWGGTGYSRYSSSELAGAIVSSWMSSPLHRAWLLHGSLKSSAVSIVNDDRGQYASWTFWTGEAGEGPELVNKAARLWEAETGGSIPWLDWLDSKGYPDNTEWLYH